MITVLTILDITPGHEDEWDAIWQRATSLHEHQPGFRHSRLLRDADNRARYVILSEWDRRSDYDAFIREMGTEWLKRGLHYLMQPARVSFLEQAAPEQEASPALADARRAQ